MGKHYSIKFKLHIVKLILEEHWGVREVAEVFNILGHTSVITWLQRFEKYGINGLRRQSLKPRTPKMPKNTSPSTADNPQDIKALLKELEYLRAENAVLKKLKELEERRQKKKKSSTN